MTADWRLITVRPPWSCAIAHLGKPVENRSRSTSYRGPVAIHAGRRFDARAVDNPALVQAAYERAGGGVGAVGVLAGADSVMHYGHVVALAELVDSHPDDGQCCTPWGERSHTLPGTGLTVIHHLVLADVVPLAAPIPARGQLGLPWRADASLHAALDASPEAAERRQRTVASEDNRPGPVTHQGHDR